MRKGILHVLGLAISGVLLAQNCHSLWNWANNAAFERWSEIDALVGNGTVGALDGLFAGTEYQLLALLATVLMLVPGVVALWSINIDRLRKRRARLRLERRLHVLCAVEQAAQQGDQRALQVLAHAGHTWAQRRLAELRRESNLRALRAGLRS